MVLRQGGGRPPGTQHEDRRAPHKYNLMRKLGSTTGPELVKYAIAHRLIALPVFADLLDRPADRPKPSRSRLRAPHSSRDATPPKAALMRGHRRVTAFRAPSVGFGPRAAHPSTRISHYWVSRAARNPWPVHAGGAPRRRAAKGDR